ncbi:MAG TPA: OmpH family outer membrane protein [Gallionella sp.]|nr:OmpH family outer membrane protein [Gallionella sp.]
MKTIFKAVLLAAILNAGVVLAGDFKVGVVDTERVLRESAPAIKAEKKIEKEFSSREQEIKALAKQAKDLQASLERDALTLSDSDRRNKERELSGMNVNLQRLQREFREDLNLRKNEELAVVLERANKAIQIIAETEKYDLILQEAAYRNIKIDITDKVIAYLGNDKSDNKTDSKTDK